jgi:RNA polymerase sigma-70 factor (ECF subfamily)
VVLSSGVPDQDAAEVVEPPLEDGCVRPTLEGVFRAEFSYVSHAVLRLGVVEREVDDVTHDVFFTVHRLLPSFDARRPIRPWLFAIAVRHAADYRRRVRSRRELVTDTPPDVEDDARAPDSAAEANQMRAIVLRALDTLDLGKRAVLVMHDIDGHTAPEIAEALGVPLNTVYSRLRVARERFRDEILAAQQDRSS